MVVFDEAHHCQKKHPYNQLLNNYHKKIATEDQCKILGLTASPAGKADFQPTLEMLLQLQNNMLSNVAVVKTEARELNKFQSNAKISCVATAPSNVKEEQIEEELRKYLLLCYMRLCAETDIKDRVDLGIHNLQDLSEDIIEVLETTIDQAKPLNPSSAKKLEIQNLIQHAKTICMCLNVLTEMGCAFAIEELQTLMATDFNCGFEFARSLGLQVDDLLASIMSFAKELNGGRSNFTDGDMGQNSLIMDSFTPTLHCLVEEITGNGRINWGSQGQSHVVLVLVRQRSTAESLCATLQNHPSIQHLGLQVVYIVGHGAGSGGVGGMTVAQQERTLKEICENRYQIVIATSVAEEGIDFPECELVICMNPPTTVTALVQMRGRARRKNSNFVVICRDPGEETKMKNLLKQEENMTIAANQLASMQEHAIGN